MDVNELDVIILKDGTEGVVLEVFKDNLPPGAVPSVMIEKTALEADYELPIVPISEIEKVIIKHNK